MKNSVSVDVCIVTYLAPDLLSRAIESLLLLDLADTRLRIIVVDNDRDGSAFSVVQGYQNRTSIPINYAVEDKKGIPFARNRALSMVSGDMFAFVDDDERVSPDWLVQMLNAMHTYNASVVFGPVISVLPNDAPKWAVNHHVFNRPRRKTGAYMQLGGTGNVLIRKDCIATLPMHFNNLCAETGGEDVELFYRMFLAGYRMVWCNEAVVEEDVPADRISVDWACRRAFCAGQSYSRFVVLKLDFVRRLSWYLLRIVRLLAGVIVLPFARLVSFPTYSNSLTKLSGDVGQLSVIFGDRFIYQQYSARRYRNKPLAHVEK